MKKSKRSYAIVLVLVFMMIFSSGCDTIKSFFNKDDKKTEQNDSKTGIDAKGNLLDLSKSDRDKISKLIGDYYKGLFQDPIESYNKAGIIPDKVKDLIASRTLTEGVNNPEVGLHYPRYVELNGSTVVGYEILNSGNNGGVNATFIGKSSQSYLYYVKVQLKAKCMSDETFNLNYKQNPQTGIFEKSATAAIDEQQMDSVRILAKYDVEVIKDNGAYKILRAKEASTRPGFQSRIMLLNNDFVQRLPYINIEKTTGKNDYANKQDGKKYESEKAVIESFFKNLEILDSERMNLLSAKWKAGLTDFTDFTNNILKLNVDKNSKEIMEIPGDYTTKFGLESFPLQANMQKIVSIKNFSIIPHPGYTEKQKKYIVTFDATIEKSTGVIGQRSNFKYDYFVSLSGDGDSIKVNAMYLNNYTYLNMPKQQNQEAQPTPVK